MSRIWSPCSRSSCATTTVIDLTAPWSLKRRCRANQPRTAQSLRDRFSADFITRTRGRHDRCTFAALQCLEHIIVLNERHLLAVLTEFVRYYNHDRPHRTLELRTPVPRPPMSGGVVVSRPILGGLHHDHRCDLLWAPSTGRHAPLTPFARFEQRKHTTAPTSSGVPNRPAGSSCLTNSAIALGSSFRRRSQLPPSYSIGPGATAFAVTPVPASDAPNSAA